MDIITADTIQQYNQFFGVKTMHPKIGIIHFYRSENQPTHKIDIWLLCFILSENSRNNHGLW